jgi:hypothetical protein
MLDEGIYFNVRKKKKIHLRRVHKKASLLTRIPVFLSKNSRTALTYLLEVMRNGK